MDVVALILYATLIAMILLWAKCFKLDLGFRRPAFKGVWPWLLLFVLWRALEPVIGSFYPEEVDSENLERSAQLSLWKYIVKGVVLAPLFEELLFRAALFSALVRRWGIWPAVVIPSLLWAFVHVQYGQSWTMAWIAGLGILLAVIRWKGGSLYLPLSLHAAHNLATVPANYGMADVFW